MTNQTLETYPLVWARVAGWLYLIIIVLGLFSEIFVRSTLIIPGDATATASHIMGNKALFCFGFLADSIMFVSDIALAVILFILLKSVNPILALMALCFRLMQTAVIALNLLHYYAALLLLKRFSDMSIFEPNQIDSMSSFFLELHSYGYDLGLILFGIHCLMLGYLIANSLYLPRALGYLVMAAGVTYLVGSYTRFLLPTFVDVIAPIYLISIVSELGLCLWLLVKGVDLECWREVVAKGNEYTKLGCSLSEIQSEGLDNFND